MIFKQLYESCFPTSARWVAKMNGSFEDASDIFQDALIIYYEKNQIKNFEINTSVNAYILGIVKHLWIRKFKDDARNVSLSEIESRISIPSDFFPAPNTEKLLQFLESTGRQCLELLSAFYYEGLNMKQLSQRMNFKGERSATVQKYKCIEKLRNTIKQKAIGYEDFVE
ncbi:MAG: sigma-70 family RNA polymerase sigma factor [Cyclobacteriaceae bacterium]|nr:sigma-70 family RNA polymerase sigma factor [Cyclobacteriaceae bacterium]